MALRYGRRIRRKATKRVAKPKRRVGSSVRALATRVRALSRRVAHNTAKQNLVLKWGPENIAGDYQSYNLCDWSSMTPIFGTDSTDYVNANKIYLKKMYLNYRLEQGSEPSNTTFHMFVVSLRDNANTTPRFNPATGAISLTANQDYSIHSGMTFMNPRVWKIHWHKRAYFTNFDASQSITGPTGATGLVVKRGSAVVYPRVTITNPTGNAAALRSSLDPSKQYYFIVFSDNSIVDGQYPVFTLMNNVSVDVAM